MSLTGEKVLLRVYLQSADRPPLTPTYQRVVAAARQAKLAGATVLKGIFGAGYHGVIKHSAWSMIEHVPVIVEIVDDAEKIASFVQGPLDRLMIGGMLTLERAAVAMYRARPGKGQPAQNLASVQIARPLKPLSTMPAIPAGPHMTINEEGILLRIFIGESDRFNGKPLFEAIVQKARELGLAGATVLRGTEGFGANSVVHRAGLLEMSTDLPIVIELVDTEPNIRRLLPDLETMVGEGMITMEYVVILMYRHEQRKATTG